MTQRDILQPLGDLAAIGSYFRLNDIQRTLNNQNHIIYEQNVLRDIIFNFKHFIKTTFIKINDPLVKSFELLRIFMYLDIHKITTHSFQSFPDKEYFSKFYKKLKQIELDLQISESIRNEYYKFDNATIHYYIAKKSLPTLINLSENKRKGTLIILFIVLFIILAVPYSLFSVGISLDIKTLLLILGIPSLIGITVAFQSNRLNAEVIAAIPELKYFENFKLDEIIQILKSKKFESQKFIKEIFTEHVDFQITHTDLYDELMSK